MEFVAIYARINNEGKADWDTLFQIKDSAAEAISLAVRLLPSIYKGPIATIEDSELTPQEAKKKLLKGINAKQYTSDTILVGYIECGGINQVKIERRLNYITAIGLKKDGVWE